MKERLTFLANFARQFFREVHARKLFGGAELGERGWGDWSIGDAMMETGGSDLSVLGGSEDGNPGGLRVGSSSADGPSFCPGDLCGAYRITHALAIGEICETYRATETDTGRQAIVKHLGLSDEALGESRAAALRERLVRLGHPHVVELLDVGVSSRAGVWVAMELVCGTTLRDMLLEKRIDLQTSLQYAVDVAGALEAIHVRGRFHGDLKPENIFVAGDGGIRVGDGGIVQVLAGDEGTEVSSGRVVGTLAYMAPERIRGKGLGASSDIYALGLIVYEMLAGHPFERLVQGDDLRGLVHAQLAADPEPLPMLLQGFPDSVWRVIARALCKDPGHRWATVHDMRVALGLASAEFLADCTASLPPTDTQQHDWTSKGRVRLDDPWDLTPAWFAAPSSVQLPDGLYGEGLQMGDLGGAEPIEARPRKRGLDRSRGMASGRRVPSVKSALLLGLVAGIVIVMAALLLGTQTASGPGQGRTEGGTDGGRSWNGLRVSSLVHAWLGFRVSDATGNDCRELGRVWL